MRRELRLGAEGEAVVARHYEQLGYRVLARRWRCERGELDLVVARDGLVAFCEVKTRSSTRHGTPAEAVDHRKQERLRRLALAWLREHGGGYAELRFDVAAVHFDGRAYRVELIAAAF